MKLSEMTNEQIADAIETAFCASSSEFGATMREAAARLRTLTLLAKAHRRLANDIVANESNILNKLKVAEDALEGTWMYASKLPHQWPLPERVRAKMKNALAAIREGGAK